MIPHIYQLLMGYSKGDAISNFADWMHATFTSYGMPSKIYAENFDQKSNSNVYYYTKLSEHISKNSIIIVHYSLGSSIVQYLSNLNIRVVVLFHGITPPEWFEGVNPVMQRLSQQGYDELPLLRGFTSQAYAVSSYASKVLEQNGFQNVKIFPPTINLARFGNLSVRSGNAKIAPNKNVLDFIFVGRIIPQKRQDILIRFLHRFQTVTKRKARLTLVGSHSDYQNYFSYLKKLSEFLNISNDIIFTGHTSSTKDLSNYYCDSDFFLCASQWESFCVPIIEAMYHKIPVICADTSAAVNTMGNSGICVSNFESTDLCFIINGIFNDWDLKNLIINNQIRELELHSSAQLRYRLDDLINTCLQK